MPSKRVVTFWLDTGAPISLLPCEHHCGCLPRLSHPGSSGAARRAQPQVSCARGGGCSPLIPAYASSGRRDPPRGEDAAPNHATPERHPPDLAVVAPGDRQAAIQELQAALDAGVEHAFPTAIDRLAPGSPALGMVSRHPDGLAGGVGSVERSVSRSGHIASLRGHWIASGFATSPDALPADHPSRSRERPGPTLPGGTARRPGMARIQPSSRRQSTARGGPADRHLWHRDPLLPRGACRITNPGVTRPANGRRAGRRSEPQGGNS